MQKRKSLFIIFLNVLGLILHILQNCDLDNLFSFIKFSKISVLIVAFILFPFLYRNNYIIPISECQVFLFLKWNII